MILSLVLLKPILTKISKYLLLLFKLNTCITIICSTYIPLFDCYLFRSLYYQYAKYLSFFNYLKHLNLKYFVYIFNLKATL